jgi:uncharacterized protein YdhG (YjbR/CyaY superfamily)
MWGLTVPRSAAQTIDEYIAGFPEQTRRALEEVRAAIREAAPDAVETVSYAIPTFDLRGRHLVHFAGYERHVGFYPSPDGIAAFAAELAGFQSAKGSVRFPLDAPLPLDLVRRMTAYRVEQVLAGGR